jgi:FkbM family methyltransferase
MNREPWLHSCVPASGDVFIDVGANTGDWTRWLSDRFDWVHAIEPNPAVLLDLRNTLPKNVTVHECAAWSSDGVGKFTRYLCRDHLSGYFDKPFLGTTSDVVGVVEIPIQRIDTMGIHGRVDFVKIDCEGGELEAVRGAAGILKANHPRMMIEIHANPNFQGIVDLLAPLEYSTSIIRHPAFPFGAEFWDEHFWLDCKPNGGDFR